MEIIGGGTPDTNNTAYWNGNIDWYSPTEIGNKPYVSGSLKKISVLGLQKSSAKILPANKTILFTSRAGIGDMAILTKQGTTNQGFQSFILKNDVDIYFLYSMGFKIKDFALKNASGSTFLEISKSQLSQMKLYLPSLKEQTQIGNFFKQLDDTIALHQRELEKFKILKTSYLENIFLGKVLLFTAKNTITWEQRKLGELADIRRGASPRPIQDEKWFDKNSKIGWLRISDVTEQNGRIHFIEQKLSFAGQEKTLVLNEPHLILSITATIGKPVINYVPTGIHDGFIVFLNLKTDMEFLFQWLEIFRPQWQKLGQSGSQVNINSELVRDQIITLPKSKEEQTQIGNFFKQLDDTIALHQKELAKYQQIKAACLEKMFVE